MTTWTAYLTTEELTEVRQAAVDAGLVTPARLEALTASIDNLFISTLPPGGAPTDRLQEQLNAMNRVHNLRNGDVPIAQWLDAAVLLSGGTAQTDVFSDALDRVQQAPPLIPEPAAPADRTLDGGLEGMALTAAPVEDEPNLDIVPEAMIAGADQTVRIGFLEGGIAASKAVLKVLVHRHMDGEPEMQPGDQPFLVNGTGWFIAPGLVITNHHVVNARGKFPVAEPDATAEDLELQAAHTTIIYDYLDENEASETLTTRAGALQASDPTLDFAILRLPDGAESRGPLRLLKHAVKKRPAQALGYRVNVLQHPNGKPMKLGFRDNFVVLGTNDELMYLTDTDRGSSGSPVFDDTWMVAALHARSQAWQGPELQIRGRKIKRANSGTPIPTIMKHLETNHPALFEEIEDGQS